VLLAASMLGATVMPHAIYLHSSLSRDRHLPGFDPENLRRVEGQGTGATITHLARLPRLLRATKVDVMWSLVIAGSVNIAMLLLAAGSLRGVAGTDTISGAHHAIVDALGPAIGAVFAIGLLASGLASTSVGAYAGAVVMGGLIKRRIPMVVRRLVTLVPALVVLSIGTNPTQALVISQVVLSLGIPFAIIPLVRLTSSRDVMGGHVASPVLRTVSWVVVGLILALNVALLVISLAGVW
jgi:manganese transport protein